MSSSTNHISVQEAIAMARPGPNGKLILIDSDGFVKGLIVLDMAKPPAPVSVTILFIDVCTRDDVTFDRAIKRVGRDCLANGVYVYHLIHSTSHGVLALREEYGEGLNLANFGAHEEEP